MKPSGPFVRLEGSAMLQEHHYTCSDCGRTIISDFPFDETTSVRCQKCDPDFASLLDNKHNKRGKGA